MAKNNDKFTYRVTWSEDDAEFVGLCAEFPSLSWLAQTPEAALKGIRNLVDEVISNMLSNKESVLEPIPNGSLFLRDGDNPPVASLDLPDGKSHVLSRDLAEDNVSLPVYRFIDINCHRQVPSELKQK